MTRMAELDDGTNNFEFKAGDVAVTSEKKVKDGRWAWNGTVNNDKKDTSLLLRGAGKKSNEEEGDFESNGVMTIGGKKDGKDVTYRSTWNHDKATGMKTKENMRKFDDFFHYAYYGKKVPQDTEVAQCSTNADCGNSGILTQCCVSVLMKENDGTQSMMHRCMNKAVASRNFEMTLNDFEVSMNCVGKDNGSAGLVAGAAASLSLAALTLF